MSDEWEKVEYISEEEFEVIESVKDDGQFEGLSHAATAVKTESPKTREEPSALSTSGDVKQEQTSAINASDDSSQPSSRKSTKSVLILCFPYVNRDATFFKADELTQSHGLWSYRKPECSFSSGVLIDTDYNQPIQDLSTKWINAWGFHKQLEERSRQIKGANQGFVSPSPEEVANERVKDVPELAWDITEKTINGHQSHTEEWVDKMYKKCKTNEDFEVRHLTVEEWRNFRGDPPIKLKSEWDAPVERELCMHYHTGRSAGCTLGSRETDKSVVGDSSDTLYYLLDKSGKQMTSKRDCRDHNRTVAELRTK